jgi:hypothetical protein
VFRPDPGGAPLLPAITSVHRAVSAFEELIRQRKLTREQTIDCMATTPEGQRVAECGEIISQLKLRDPGGTVVKWKTIAILDLEEIGHNNLRKPARERVGTERFMISATMKRPKSSTIQ